MLLQDWYYEVLLLLLEYNFWIFHPLRLPSWIKNKHVNRKCMRYRDNLLFEHYFLSASYCASVVQKVTENTKCCHWKYFTLSSVRINYISFELKKMVWKCVFSLVVQLLFIYSHFNLYNSSLCTYIFFLVDYIIIKYLDLFTHFWAFSSTTFNLSEIILCYCYLSKTFECQWIFWNLEILISEWREEWA